MLEGLSYHEVFQYFNISDIEIPDVPVLDSTSWHRFHTLLIEANVIDRLDLPTLEDIPTVPPRHASFVVKKPFYTLWCFWIIVLIVISILCMIFLYVYFNGCLTMKNLLNKLPAQCSPADDKSLVDNVELGDVHPVSKCSI
jgi:hypothetical protein